MVGSFLEVTHMRVIRTPCRAGFIFLKLSRLRLLLWFLRSGWGAAKTIVRSLNGPNKGVCKSDSYKRIESPMRYLINLFSAAGIALLLATSVQAETITPLEASHYAGSAITVEGVVSQVSTSGGGTTFINFGGRYPKCGQFTGVGPLFEYKVHGLLI